MLTAGLCSIVHTYLVKRFRFQQKPSTPLHDKTDFFTLNSACSLNISAIWQEARTVPVLSCLSRCCLSLRCRAGTSLRTSSLRVTTAFVVQEPQKRCFEVKRMIFNRRCDMCERVLSFTAMWQNPHGLHVFFFLTPHWRETRNTFIDLRRWLPLVGERCPLAPSPTWVVHKTPSPATPTQRTLFAD